MSEQELSWLKGSFSLREAAQTVAFLFLLTWLVTMSGFAYGLAVVTVACGGGLVV